MTIKLGWLRRTLLRNAIKLSPEAERVLRCRPPSSEQIALVEFLSQELGVSPPRLKSASAAWEWIDAALQEPVHRTVQ